MACPYFLPQRELPTGLWVHEPRWPLGKAYSGLCCSRAGERLQPPGRRQEELCNYGYARGICELFPPESPGDAVRFSVAQQDGSRLQLVYVLEKEHAPVQFAMLEYSAPSGVIPPPQPDALARQAEAFAESYMAHANRTCVEPPEIVL